MKEIMAFIRVNKVGETRDALELNGIFAYTCRKCLGRGKGGISAAGQSLLLASENDNSPARLIAKRMFIVNVPDEDVSKAVNIIIKANCTGNPGDGKIFVRNVEEGYSVRTGEKEI